MRPCAAALAAASILLIAACSGSGASTPTPAATPAPAISAGTGTTAPTPSPASGAGTGIAAAPQCAPGTEPTVTAYAGWPVPGRAQATGDMIPLLVSSQVVAGPSCFLFSVIVSKNAILAAAEVPVTVSFYDLAADPATPVATTDAIYLDPGNGRGLYRAGVDLRCWGDWGLDVTATLSSGTVTSKVQFTVLPSGTIPAIGSRAPQSDSPTAATLDDVKRISTDDDPDLDFYKLSIAQAVTSGKPSAILFATPQFCQTATCGPTLDHLKAIAKDFKDTVDFVNVEPYQLLETTAGLQPKLDANGQLQAVQAAVDWGLVTEPYLFIVDRDGRIFASFEGVLGEDEVRAALIDVAKG